MIQESIEAKMTEIEVGPMTYLDLPTKVLHTNPDYHKRLQNQRKVLDCMAMVIEELQLSVGQLQAFMGKSTQCFQKGSVQLGKRSTQQPDPSPASNFRSFSCKPAHHMLLWVLSVTFCSFSVTRCSRGEEWQTSQCLVTAWHLSWDSPPSRLWR